jgi:ATP-dependent RNA helicase RhlE
MNFNQLGLQPALSQRCDQLGYVEPTPIQQQAIPVIISGSDLIGCAETGTGKTAAFLLPILHRLMEKPTLPGVRVLVLAPTRELALQIESNYRELAPKRAPRCATLIGGAGFGQQFENLRRGATVCIATPGRLLDHLERRTISLAQVEVLVLDEADRMLDMGFLPAINRVLALLPATRQTLLFSATLSSQIEKIARSTMRDPKLVEVSVRGNAATLVEQTAYPVAIHSKMALLLDLLERKNAELARVLVFTRTRREAERLAHILEAREHKVNRIHADRSQPQREAALRAFKTGKARVLVATDIAARGIDVDDISHVINYDVPAAPEDYVHRIGRTGRAGRTGQAITLVTPVDELSMRSIERLTGQAVERILLPAFGGATAMSGTTKTPTAGANVRNTNRRSFRPRRASR